MSLFICMPWMPSKKLVFVHVAENATLPPTPASKKKVENATLPPTPASKKKVEKLSVAPTPKTEIVFESSSEVEESEYSSERDEDEISSERDESESSTPEGRSEEDLDSVHESDFEITPGSPRSEVGSTEEETLSELSSERPSGDLDYSSEELSSEDDGSETPSIGSTLSLIEEKALVGAFRAHQATPEITVFGKFGEACNAITVPQNANLEELSLRFADEFGFYGKAIIYEEIEEKEPGCLVIGYQYFRKLVYAEKINDGDFFQVREAPAGKASRKR